MPIPSGDEGEEGATSCCQALELLLVTQLMQVMRVMEEAQDGPDGGRRHVRIVILSQVMSLSLQSRAVRSIHVWVFPMAMAE